MFVMTVATISTVSTISTISTVSTVSVLMPVMFLAIASLRTIRRHLTGRLRIRTAHGGSCSAADRRPQNGAVFTAHAVSNRGTCGTAQCAAYHRTAIDRKRTGACRKKQQNCK